MARYDVIQELDTCQHCNNPTKGLCTYCNQTVCVVCRKQHEKTCPEDIHQEGAT